MHSRPCFLDRRPHTERGFTLIELMIVVAVVAILAAIAYPSYNEQVRKSRRGQAKADIAEVTQLAERFHTVNNTYSGFTLPFTRSPRDGGSSHYTISFIGTQSTFTVTATPSTATGQNRDKCGTLSINQAGVKTPAEATVPGCW